MKEKIKTMFKEEWAIFLLAVIDIMLAVHDFASGRVTFGIALSLAALLLIGTPIFMYLRKEDDEPTNTTVNSTAKINFVKNHVNAHVPTRGSEEAAGYDLYSASSYEIHIAPHQTVKIDTGIACELPSGTFGAIFARSGLATKRGLRLANSTAIIDSDYRGSYIVALHNDSDEIQTVEPGERIAQLVLLPYIPMNFNEVHKLDSTARGAGGFGSTGTK